MQSSAMTGNTDDAQRKIIFRLSRALRKIRAIVRRSAGPPSTKVRPGERSAPALLTCFAQNTVATLTVERLKAAQKRIDTMTKQFKNADSLAR